VSSQTGDACTEGITLAAGDYRATVLTMGASLGSLTLRGVDLVVPAVHAKPDAAFVGSTLVPWPNRIAGGQYEFSTTVHQLVVNEPATGCAVHGLAYGVPWEVADWSASEATLMAQISPAPGYPFNLRARVTYRLSHLQGLTIAIGAVNEGAAPAPYGASTHPYLTCGLAPVDECRLSLPATQVLTVDEQRVPVGQVSVTEAGMDFRTPRVLGAQRVDHTFTGLPDQWQLVLTHSRTGIRSRLTAREPWAQLYSGELVGRRGVAVEPMTCPPDAFNSGTDLIVLRPGGRHELELRIDGVVSGTRNGLGFER
jgi:aldose 1-epimerase